MKVILSQNVDRVGPVGEIVNVRTGFARNYLIPNGFAVVATDANVRAVEQARSKDIALEKDKKKQATELSQKISELTLTIEMRTGEENKLFGSVTSADVQKLMAEKGIEVDRKDVLIHKAIRKTGTFAFEVRCYTNVKAPCKLQVVKKQEK